jgi:hypothetical protein
MFIWPLALWRNLRTCYRLHRTSPLDFIKNQMNKLYIITSNFFKIPLNIIFQSALMCTNFSFHFRFTHQNCVHISYLFHPLSVLLTKYNVSIYELTWDEWGVELRKKWTVKDIQSYSLLESTHLHSCSKLFYCSQASKKKQFSSLHHWLLFPAYVDALSSNRDGDKLVLSEDPLITALEQLDLPLDSHVTVACPGPNRFLLQDVYRLVMGQPLTVTLPRNWSPEQDWSLGPRRDNYGGEQLRTVVIVSIIFMMMKMIILILSL